MLNLRTVPGLAEPDLRPPVVAERGDPFAALRVAHLLARVPRALPVSLADLVDTLNAEHLDWSFSMPVVSDVVVQLRANWIADYRTVEGIILGSNDRGPTVTIEDSSRVDPWMIRQVEHLRETCLEQLRAFASDEEGAR